MSTTRDIYNPPPAPEKLGPPEPEPIRWTGPDLLALAVLCVPVAVCTAWTWAIDTTLGLWVTIAGVFVVLESWFSALTFLHRHPDDDRRGRRWLIFLAALFPWALSLGLGAALMLGLFRLSDWAG